MSDVIRAMIQNDAREEARMAQKQRYRQLVALAFGAAGLAVGFADAPIEVSLALWGLGALSWAVLKAI
jgi:hypothetical protein